MCEGFLVTALSFSLEWTRFSAGSFEGEFDVCCLREVLTGLAVVLACGCFFGVTGATAVL